MRKKKHLAYRIVRDFRMMLNMHEIKLLGKCPCGKCDRWAVEFRGDRIHMPKKAYDNLRFIQEMRR